MKRKEDLEEPDFEAAEKVGRQRSPLVTAGVLMAVVVVGVVAILFLQGEKEERTAVSERPAVKPSTESREHPRAESVGLPAEEAVEKEGDTGEASGEAGSERRETDSAVPEVPLSALPGLDESNELVEKLLRDCLPEGIPPLPPSGGSLLRLFVVVVDNVSEGASPRPHLAFLGFTGDFGVVEREGNLYVDPESYHRFDFMARIFAGMDHGACAAAYGSLKPLIDEAYRDLGYPDRPFDEALKGAITRIVGAALPGEDALLIEGEGAYHYEDPSLEALSGIEKQLLRMGPENGRIIQESLRRLEEELGPAVRQLP